MIRPRGKIKWKEQPTVDIHGSIPWFIPVSEASKNLESMWADRMCIGSLWRLMYQMDIRKDIKAGMPYLKRDLYDIYPGHPIHFASGTLAIYAGAIRVDEMSKNGPLRLLRHCFIANGGKYIITDFINIEPVI